MALNYAADVVVSIDMRGVIEYVRLTFCCLRHTEHVVAAALASLQHAFFFAFNFSAVTAISTCLFAARVRYWDAGDYQFPGKTASDPKGKVLFQYKSETDLYDLAKNKARPHSLAISPDGHSFAVTSSDAQVRVFQFLTGKLRRKYDESLEAYDKLIADGALDVRCLLKKMSMCSCKPVLVVCVGHLHFVFGRVNQC